MATRVRCAALAPVFTAAERGLSDWTACLYNWNRASAAPLIGWRAPGGSAGSGQWRVKARILNIMGIRHARISCGRAASSIPCRDVSAVMEQRLSLLKFASRHGRAAQPATWLGFHSSVCFPRPELPSIAESLPVILQKGCRVTLPSRCLWS
jgi:hypothetical protein